MVSGASSVSGGDLSVLYIFYDMKDKNGNGIIEKKGLKTLWRDEGYAEEIDLNGDGKLVPAEIRYYLHYLELPTGPVPRRGNTKYYDGTGLTHEVTKKENPFTEEDRKIILGMYSQFIRPRSTQGSPHGLALIFKKYAVEMAELQANTSEIRRAFNSALDQALQIKDTDKLVKVLDSIVKDVDNVVKKGWFDKNEAVELLEYATGIRYIGIFAGPCPEQDFYRASISMRNANLMTDWGMDATKTLRSTLKEASKIVDPLSRSEMIGKILIAMKKNAADVDEVAGALQLALDAAWELEPGDRVGALSSLALNLEEAAMKPMAWLVMREAIKAAKGTGSLPSVSAMRRVGITEPEIAYFYQTALKTTKDPWDRYCFFAEMDRNKVETGIDQAVTENILRDAFKIASSKKDPSSFTPFRPIDIAERMGKAGMDKQEVMDAFRAVLPEFMKGVKVEPGKDYCPGKEATEMVNAMARAGLNAQEAQKLFDESTSGICIEDYLHVFCRNIVLSPELED